MVDVPFRWCPPRANMATSGSGPNAPNSAIRWAVYLPSAEGGSCGGSGEMRTAEDVGAVHELIDRTDQG
jgi:hypothetical protein